MSIRWLSAVWLRSPYRGEKLLLHLALADFANDEGTCFPSVRTLARKARCSEVWARKSIHEMIRDGNLEIIERGLGRGNVNRYRLLNFVEEEITGLPLSDKGVTTEAQRGKSSASLTTTQNHQEPSIDDQFIEFWKAYPRKVGKGKARVAFSKAMGRRDAPTMHDLLAAVVRYASTITDSRYIAHPTTWLNAERWLDEIDETTTPAATVRVDPEIGRAIGLGNVCAWTGRSIDELHEMTRTLGDEARAAALEAYNRNTNGRTA